MAPQGGARVTDKTDLERESTRWRKRAERAETLVEQHFRSTEPDIPRIRPLGGTDELQER